MKVAIIGYGRMGREIESLLLRRGHEVPLKIDADNRGDLNAENLRGIDVAIEFTTPHTAFENVMQCLKCNTPIVCGSTGWSDKIGEAKEYCQAHNGTFFYASNYSVGVNMFFRLNKELARMMNSFPEYGVSMREVHHVHKKDSPSGTAVTLAEGILENMERKSSWVNETSTNEDVLGIVSVREDAVPGTHEVRYESPSDVIDIVHTAKDRSGFVMGAVLAAEFAATHKGVLSMDDLLTF